MNKIIVTVPLSLALLVSITGCGKADSNSSTAVSPTESVPEIDGTAQFESILQKVDAVIGKRFQSMQMAGMTMASYQFDGPIDTVVDIVEPLVIENGYSVGNDDMMKNAMEQGQAEQAMMPNANMDLVGSKTYQHENGNMINIMRMDVSVQIPDAPAATEMQMLTIQMTNVEKMQDFGKDMLPNDQSTEPQEESD